MAGTASRPWPSREGAESASLCGEAVENASPSDEMANASRSGAGEAGNASQYAGEAVSESPPDAVAANVSPWVHERRCGRHVEGAF